MKTELLNTALPFIVLVLVPFVVFLAVKFGYTNGANRATQKH